MNNTDQDRQDQRTNSVMEDSTTMTVEFLRARLLSERSVSRSARQRADELAKRVAKLEEQLRIVSLQRMKAEKARADVLAILESNGVSDVSETYDSNSDQDTPCESKVGNRSFNEDNDSVNSKVRKSESEELSVSDLDYSQVPGRSLSWKGCKDSPQSLEKHKDPSLRRRSSFASPCSSPKHRAGKSCRQIRHKESRSIAEEFKANPIKVDTPENGVSTSSGVFPNGLDVGPGILGGVLEGAKTLVEGPRSGCLENEQNASRNEFDDNVYGRDGDMEKALQHQAQLIGQYEAMEKAQREWEEKFRENNNSTPDSCDPGNRSDVTEERYEIKAQAPHHVGTIASESHVTKSEAEDLSQIQSNGVLLPSHVATRCLQEHRILASESPTQDFAFPMVKGRQNKESLGNNYHPSLHGSHHNTNSNGSHDSPGSQSSHKFASKTVSHLNKGKASGSQREQYALVPHKAPKEVGNVLEALKQARQSLQQKIDKLPLVGGLSGGTSVGPPVQATIPGDKVEIPIGCAGLFRLPTDFLVEGNARADLINSSARLSLGNYYPDTGVPAAVSNQFLTSPYPNRVSLSTEDPFPASQYGDVGSRISTQRPYFDHLLDTALPSSNSYTYSTYPTYPINPSYPDLLPRIPTREGFSTWLPNRTVGMPPPDHLSFSDDHTRSNMYR